MKPLSLVFLPVVALLVSACAPTVVGPGYGYGPGPSPRVGYYWNGTVYIEGESPYRHNNRYNQNVTDVNDVNVNRTTVNERTVNDTNINKTNVNDRTVNKRNANKTNVKPKARTTAKKDENKQQGNQ